MDTTVSSSSSQPGPSSQDTQPHPSKTSSQASKTSTKQEPAAAAAITPLFRPINFESSSPTPEGFECSGSKSTLGNGSESGSDCAQDSAYSSDNTVPAKNNDGQLPCKKITATLQNKSLWKDFKRIGNEMIVTKPGRRLFPALLVSLHGLDPDMDYTIYLKVATADNQRYRYINMKWCATGESEVIQNEEKQCFRHPSSPNTGQFWMKRPISFKSIKITHYSKSQHGNILLHTMHKYMMKVVIDPADDSGQTVIPLTDSTFIAVSAYQNVEITQLKIDKNPFAKGFRYKVRGSGRGTPTSSSSSSSSTGNGGNGAIAFVSPHPHPAPMPATPRDSPMLAYWQQLHMQGMLPHAQYNPILTMASPTSLQSPTPSVNSSKEPSPGDQVIGFSTCPVPAMANGIASPYPLFYHHPFIPAPPPYIVPTQVVGPSEKVEKE